MRVGLVILHADPQRGGAERYTIDLAVALARRGIETALISSSSGPELPGVVPVVIPSKGLTRTACYHHWLEHLEKHLQTARYDVVHAALPIPRCDVYHPHAGLAADAVENGHRKYAGWKRWPAQWANRWNSRRQAFAAIERQLVLGPRPPVVISLSRYVQTAIEAFYPLPQDRHACLFNAVDLQRFDPRTQSAAGKQWRQQCRLRSDDIAAVMIAQDFERKGLTEAIAALQRACDPRLKLVVVGKPDPAAWRQQAKAANLSERVIFAGPTTQPAACYAGADLFVLPTKHDPCSLVVLEALAMGVPVITTSRNGAAEVMRGRDHGVVLSDPTDVSSLAEALNFICDDAVRSEMSHRCLALRPQLSYEHHLDQLLQIYGRTQNFVRAA